MTTSHRCRRRGSRSPRLAGVSTLTCSIVFAMLAGGAPLLNERLITRGGPRVDLRDPGTFYETSSYGPQAVEMTARLTGAEQLIYGSDRPVIDPQPTGRDRLLQENAAKLLAMVHA